MASPDLSAEQAGTFEIYPQLERKVAIVTGGSRGLGKVIARGLLENGVNVVLNGTDQDRLGAAADELNSSRERVLPVVGDIGFGGRESYEDWSGQVVEAVPSTAELLFARGSERFGVEPGIVVHAAGVNRDGLYVRPRQTRESLEAVNGAKVSGTWELVNAVYGPWSKAKSGLFVGLSSISAAYKPIGQSLYSAANAWMENYLTVIDKEATGDGKKDGVRYIALRLGPVEEGMMLVLKEQSPKFYEGYLAMMPNGELISSHAVTNRVLELAARVASPRPQSIDVFDGGFNPNLSKPQEPQE